MLPWKWQKQKKKIFLREDDSFKNWVLFEDQQEKKLTRIRSHTGQTEQHQISYITTANPIQTCLTAFHYENVIFFILNLPRRTFLLSASSPTVAIYEKDLFLIEICGKPNGAAQTASIWFRLLSAPHLQEHAATPQFLYFLPAAY